jgi:O-antigen/teichoic acid export membrane protein
MTSDLSAPADPPVAPAPMPPSRRPLAGGAFAYVGAQAVMLAAATLTSVVIARLLGPSGTGTVTLTITLVGIGSLLFAAGLRSGIVYESSSGRWPLRQAMRETAVAAAGLGAFGGVVVLLLYALTRDSVLGGLDSVTAVAAAAASPFAVSIVYVGALALAHDRYETFALVQGAQPVAILVFAVGLGIPFGTPGAASGVAAGSLFGALAGWTSLRRYARRLGAAAGGYAAGRLKEAWRFGVKAWGGDLLQFLNYRLDLFILNAFASTSDVGVYSVAVTVTTLGWILPNALTTVMFPRAANLEAATRAGTVSQAEADLTAIKAARHTVIVLVPSALVLLVLLFVAVPVLYGPRFADSTELGLLLLPGVVVIGFGRILTAVTTGRGHPLYALYLGLLTAPLTVALYLVVIPPFGAAGAAVATTCSYTLTTIAAWIFYRRVTGIPFAQLMPRAAELRESRSAAAGAVRSLRDRLRRQRPSSA